MLFTETNLSGVFLITLQPMKDERGYFARSFCKKQLENLKLHSDFVQCNLSYNEKKGTLRGLHYQVSPHEETKIVSCQRGAIFDILVDVRENSPTYGQWLSFELSAKNLQALYIPAGFAHGFQTLCDDVEVFYHMGNYYYPDAARGICWNDPQMAIPWPNPQVIMSERDKNFPRLGQ